MNVYEEHQKQINNAENFNDFNESRENDVVLGQVPH